MTSAIIRPDQRYSREARSDLDVAVDLIDGIKLKPAAKIFGGAPVPASQFRDALLFSSTLEEVWKDDGVWIGSEIFDLGPVHGRALSLACESEDDVAVLTSVDSVTARETKGLIRRPMARMLRVCEAHVDRDGVCRTSRMFYGMNPDGSLVNIDNVNPKRYQPLPSKTYQHQFVASVTAGFQLYLRYSWTVSIRSVGSNFALRIPTTPEGARALLALRDVEAGMVRRKALRHWVTDHRRRRNADDVEKGVHVRAHLRGATTFKWDDLEGVESVLIGRSRRIPADALTAYVERLRSKGASR